jgi:hypothetical protein
MDDAGSSYRRLKFLKDNKERFGRNLNAAFFITMY